MDFRGDMVNEETTKKGPNMVINQVSLGTGEIDVSSDYNFGLEFEININVSSEFDTALDGVTNMTHKIMRVGTSVYKKSLAINHEMVQDRWRINRTM